MTDLGGGWLTGLTLQIWSMELARDQELAIADRVGRDHCAMIVWFIRDVNMDFVIRFGSVFVTGIGEGFFVIKVRNLKKSYQI